MILNIYGRNPVREALRSRFKVEEVWIADSADGRTISQIRNLSEKRAIPVRRMPKNDLQKMAGAVVHQGVTARVIDFAPLKANEFWEIVRGKINPAFVILDQIQDPQNMGAILRTAEVAGIDAVIVPQKGSAEINETIAKTSAGALFHIPIFYCRDLETLIADFHEHNLISMAAVSGGQKVIYEADMKNGLVLVIGSEGKGVRKNIARLCSEQITIPQYGNIDSLNASVAAAIIMYEMVRQRRKIKD